MSPNKVREQLSFRTGKEVVSFRIYDGYSYPICPKCHATLEREYQNYCDRCGQALSWKNYNSAKEEKDTFAAKK